MGAAAQRKERQMKMADEYQRQVADGLTIDHGTDALAHCALGLTGEAGEVADLVKKSQYSGGALNVGELKLELGDTLWYLTSIADQMGWTLEDLMIANIEKLEQRGRCAYSATALKLARLP